MCFPLQGSSYVRISLLSALLDVHFETPAYDTLAEYSLHCKSVNLPKEYFLELKNRLLIQDSIGKLLSYKENLPCLENFLVPSVRKFFLK